MSAATPQLPQHTKISGFTGSGKTLHVMARVLNPCPSREDFSRSLFSPYLFNDGCKVASTDMCL